MEQLQAFDGGTCGTSDLNDVLGFPPVLDACCGSRMFWFDRKDSRATFVDKRRERHTLPDVSSKGGSRKLVIDPDHLADFTDLPFPADTFALVVFDPPHFERNGATGWVSLKYGTLKGDWRAMLRDGFAECFRVLRPEGVLIFKWCEAEIPVSQILALTPERPLFGHRSGKQQKTHWITFMKPNALGEGRERGILREASSGEAATSTDGLEGGRYGMGLATGENTKVSFLLLMEQIRRGVVERPPKAWVDAGYCLDAPEVIAAGSHRRDITGDGEDDWLAMPTMAAREPSNVK